MQEIIQNYLNNIQSLYQSGNAREHAYRPAFQTLIENLIVDIQVINEPSYTGGNAPDFLFKKGDIPIAYAECKDINIDINSKSVQAQAQRYVDAFGKILLTNYYDFQIMIENQDPVFFSIAKLENNKFILDEENLDQNLNLLRDYLSPTPRTIRSSQKLAEIMANKARILRDTAKASLTENPNSDIQAQYQTFKQILINDLSEDDFADMYAQTLVYGLFVARYHDSTLPTFSRYEAQDLLPQTNPLLKKFFGHIAGTDYDPKIAWLVDSLVEAYLSTNVAELMHTEFTSKEKDPILHFYETFLSKYDSLLRKSRGVYYTPKAVVSFMVRAVDQILQAKFNLPQGLADTSVIEYEKKIQANDARTKDNLKKIKIQIPKVQILDPAVGTGTFLDEVIKQIHTKFRGQEGLWSSYVSNHLINRLHGFELMMTSYTMAHLKLGITLDELGYKGKDRLSVWLTNSLEEGVHEVPNLFMSQWLTEESNQASRIKSEMPIMVVLGNPPYAVSSSNKGESITKLIQDYKKDLNERKINLDDDYIKFIRFAEDQIEKTGYGIVAMITNNSFIDGITHRQMRKHLMQTFDQIYILDLHGNSKKKETAPDGSADQNVFDIMQGVSINIFVKNKSELQKLPSKKDLAEIYHSEIFGKRQAKFDFLNQINFNSINWQKLNPLGPYYFFVPKDFKDQIEYEKGFKVSELFEVNTSGVKTHHDKELVSTSKFNTEYNLSYNYRAFDNHFINYDRNLVERDRYNVMKHFILGDNLGLIFRRTIENTKNWHHIHITKNMMDINFLSAQTYNFPLYLYTQASSAELKTSSQTTPPFGHPSIGGELKTYSNSSFGGENSSSLKGWTAEQNGVVKKPNLNLEIVKEIEGKLGLRFIHDLENKPPRLTGTPPTEGNNNIYSNFSKGEENSPSLKGWQSQNDGVVSSEDDKPQSVGIVKNETTRNTLNYKSLPFNHKLQDRAKELRKAGNLAEVVFWNQVKSKKFKNYDFDRQKIIGNYIVDFYCTNCNVIIEIDGSSHNDKQEYDTERDLYLESLGLTVIHILDTDVLNNLDSVMEMLSSHPALENKLTHISDTSSQTTPSFGHPSIGGELLTFTPLDLLDYIYAVLHNPDYRDKYKEFLKIDFPRVPYPEDQEKFWQLVKLGGELRELHLLESPKVNEYITQYPIDGDNIVSKVRFEKSISEDVGKVYINETQYFDNVPIIAWEFYIGGYQPAQKWLKDRKNKTLSIDDILHYQKIIVVLSKTNQIIGEISALPI